MYIQNSHILLLHVWLRANDPIRIEQCFDAESFCLADTDALAEFNNVADMITKSVTQSSVVTADGSLKSESLAVTQSSRVTADGSLESKSLATMSAAVVYAQIPEQSTQFLRPLGPIFPIVGGDSSVKQKPSLSSLGVLSGVELKPAPTSLLDAVKRKRKKGKNQ